MEESERIETLWITMDRKHGNLNLKFDATNPEYLEVLIKYGIRFNQEDMDSALEIYKNMNQKLLQKLKLTIKSQSVNSLGTVYPEDLMSWLNVSAEELNSFVYDLYEERVLAFKYRFVCECGEQCTAYGHKLEFEPQFFLPSLWKRI